MTDICANPRWFGATPGITAVLHTWSRQLEYHPHIHFLITGGGVAPDGSWKSPQPGFLVPVHALSTVFRARFRARLAAALPGLCASIPASIWTSDWVVHSKPVGSGEKALRYLARYLYRVAIANTAILHADDQSVHFRYRDSEEHRQRTCTLTPLEFIRRFLQHVLPKGFVKVRYFGLHHPSKRQTLILQRSALHLQLQSEPSPVKAPSSSHPPPICPRCKTSMTYLHDLRRQRNHAPHNRGPP